MFPKCMFRDSDLGSVVLVLLCPHAVQRGSEQCRTKLSSIAVAASCGVECFASQCM